MDPGQGCLVTPSQDLWAGMLSVKGWGKDLADDLHIEIREMDPDSEAR